MSLSSRAAPAAVAKAQPPTVITAAVAEAQPPAVVTAVVAKAQPPTVVTAVVPSALGEVLLAATERGLWEVVLPGLHPSELLQGALRAGIQHTAGTDEATSRAAAHLSAARSELTAYFAGELREFTVALDLRTKGFYRQAQLALAGIPYGGTETYGQLAARIGRPGSARAVGTSCATNPLPLVLPCHRVVAAGGGLGGYAGGLEQKKWLLALEQGTRMTARTPTTGA